MSYQIEYDGGVLKSLNRTPQHVQSRIIARIGALSSNPRPPGSIKLSGQDAYRIRIGDYRVIYTIHDDRLLILVIEIGHRGDVYRRR